MDKITNLSTLLPIIAVEGNDHRRKAITDLLDEYGIPFELKTDSGGAGAHTPLGYAPPPVNIEIDLTRYCRSDTAGKPLVLTAHYDAVSGSTGANDNGSSVSVLLKTAYHIVQNGSSVPVRIVFFDLEEMLGVGSAAYLNDMTGEALFINLDVVGYGDRIVFCDNSDDAPFIREKLMSDANMSKYGILCAHSFPFSDAEIIRRYGHPVLGISVFPEADTANLPERLKYSVMDSMHNRRFDSIDYINYGIMETLADMLISALS